MNCRPGILVMVKPPRSGNYCDCTGKTGVVLIPAVAPVTLDPEGYRHSCGNDGVCWLVEAPRPFAQPREDGSLRVTRYFVMWDHRLVPLGSPGDDAVDETLLRLPSPRQEVTG